MDLPGNPSRYAIVTPSSRILVVSSIPRLLGAMRVSGVSSVLVRSRMLAFEQRALMFSLLIETSRQYLTGEERYRGGRDIRDVELQLEMPHFLPELLDTHTRRPRSLVPDVIESLCEGCAYICNVLVKLSFIFQGVVQRAA